MAQEHKQTKKTSESEDAVEVAPSEDVAEQQGRGTVGGGVALRLARRRGPLKMTSAFASHRRHPEQAAKAAVSKDQSSYSLNWSRRHFRAARNPSFWRISLNFTPTSVFAA